MNDDDKAYFLFVVAILLAFLVAVCLADIERHHGPLQAVAAAGIDVDQADE